MGFARFKLVVIACLAPLSVVAVTALQIANDYYETLERQETAMRDMTHVVNLHIGETVRTADVALTKLEQLVVAEHDLRNFREQSLDTMAVLCGMLNGCEIITVVERGGEVVARSSRDRTRGINVADRAYFMHAVDKGGLFVAPAVTTRMPGNPILFAISKPVRDASGKVIAVVAAHMSTRHFTAFYGLMGFNLAPTVTIFKTDGMVLARHPDMEKHVGKSSITGPLFTHYLQQAPSGVLRAVSPLDGKERIAAYRLMPEWDLVIYCGTEVKIAMAAWKRRSVWNVGAGLLGLLSVSIMFIWGYRTLMRQQGLLAQNSELDRLSHLDPLTGIANRRLFDAAFAQEWGTWRDAGKNFSLLLVDVDNFKHFNDRYGHPEGDRCLKMLAAALDRSLFRKGDLVARYGGEEFAVILHCSEEDAQDVAERMRQAVENLRIPHSASDAAPVVTVSIGVAGASTCNPQSAEGLLDCADAALYGAKSAGRNRVVLNPHRSFDIPETLS